MNNLLEYYLIGLIYIRFDENSTHLKENETVLIIYSKIIEKNLCSYTNKIIVLWKMIMFIYFRIKLLFYAWQKYLSIHKSKREN